MPSPIKESSIGEKPGKDWLVYVQHTDYQTEISTVGHLVEFSPVTADSFDPNVKYKLNSKKWRKDNKMNTYQVYIGRIAKNREELDKSLKERRVRWPRIIQSESDDLGTASELERSKLLPSKETNAAKEQKKRNAASADLESLKDFADGIFPLGSNSRVKKTIISRPESQATASPPPSTSNIKGAKAPSAKIKCVEVASKSNSKSSELKSPTGIRRNVKSQSSPLNSIAISKATSVPVAKSSSHSPLSLGTSLSSSSNAASSNLQSSPQTSRVHSGATIIPKVKSLQNLASSSRISLLPSFSSGTSNSPCDKDQFALSSPSNKNKCNLTKSSKETLTKNNRELSQQHSFDSETDSGCHITASDFVVNPVSESASAHSDMAMFEVDASTGELQKVDLSRNTSRVETLLESLLSEVTALKTNFASDVKELKTRISNLESTVSSSMNVKPPPTTTSSWPTSGVSSAAGSDSTLPLSALNTKVVLAEGIECTENALRTINSTTNLRTWCRTLLLGVFDEKAHLYRLQLQRGSDEDLLPFPRAFQNVAKTLYENFLRRTGDPNPDEKKIGKVLGALSKVCRDLSGRRNTGTGTKKGGSSNSNPENPVNCLIGADDQQPDEWNPDEILNGIENFEHSEFGDLGLD